MPGRETHCVGKTARGPANRAKGVIMTDRAGLARRNIRALPNIA